MHRSPSKSVLVASRDPGLADVRKRVLEDAGYRVVAASTARQVEKECKENDIHLVLVGYSVPPSRKRRIFMAARKHCKTPILELFSTGQPELVQQSHTYAHHAHVPEDFLEAVHSILKSA
ncbi:MAG TPA: response regulator [Terriglobales bacterium]|nr:response regulator [Terriglobales bacterium]